MGPTSWTYSSKLLHKTGHYFLDILEHFYILYVQELVTHSSWTHSKTNIFISVLWLLQGFDEAIIEYTVCPRSSDPFHLVSNYCMSRK